jgi:hypothetical protein
MTNKYRLYKYTPILTRTLSIISTGKVWYTKPRGFNDPFDCGLDLFGDIPIEEKIQVLRAKMERDGWSPEKITQQLRHSFNAKGELNQIAMRNIERLTEAIQQRRNDVGILSLSRTPQSVLMWSHYADQHKGICLEFAVPVSPSLHEVSYSKMAPRFTLHDIHVKRDAEIIFPFFTTKHKDWRYEKEYRVILDRGDILHDIPGPITAIVFGLRTSPVDESLVRKVATGLDGVRFCRCTREVGKFGVVLNNA